MLVLVLVLALGRVIPKGWLHRTQPTPTPSLNGHSQSGIGPCQANYTAFAKAIGADPSEQVVGRDIAGSRR